MDKAPIYLRGEAQREYARRVITGAPQDYVVVIKPPTRSDAQNNLLWPMLQDVSRQVNWYGRKLTPEDWKHVFTAGLRKLDVVPNLDGTGFVALGLSTSAMSKAMFSDLITMIYAFGAEKGVVWTDPKGWR